MISSIPYPMSFGAWLELLASGLITGSIYALVALGLNLQYGLMRILNIAHGEFLMLGAFVTWAAATTLGWSPLAMIPLCFGADVRAGAGGAPAVVQAADRHLAQRRLRGARADGLLRPDVPGAELRLVGVGGELRGYDYLTEPVQVGGAQFAANSCWCWAVAGLRRRALIVWLRSTLYGKGVRALMQSPTGAQLVGIDTGRLHPLMFGIGLGLSGVAGCLLSMTYTVTPAMGEPYTVTSLIVITLGGFGSMGGALAGGLLLGLVEAIGMHFTSPSLKSLLSYGIFIAVLLLRPNGLFHRKR